MAYLLHGVDSSRKLLRHPLVSGVALVMGRSKKKCQVVVADPKISREQCSVEADHTGHVTLVRKKKKHLP